MVPSLTVDIRSEPPQTYQMLEYPAAYLFVSCISFSRFTTAGSANVVVSPRVRPSAMSLSRRRMTSPRFSGLGEVGSKQNVVWLGYGADLSDLVSEHLSLRLAVGCLPSLR